MVIHNLDDLEYSYVCMTSIITSINIIMIIIDLYYTTTYINILPSGKRLHNYGKIHHF